MAGHRTLLLAASLLCASCNRPAIDPSQSLVGAKSLPTARELANETIQINQGFGEDSPGLLSFELRPDDTLSVSVSHWDSKADRHMTTAAETFHVSHDVAARLRKGLWRLRPEKLPGVEFETRPTGCRRQFDHETPVAAIIFIAEGPKPGVEDDQVGVIDLPKPQNCDSLAAIEARSIAQSAIRSLPRSKVAADFAQRTGRANY